MILLLGDIHGNTEKVIRAIASCIAQWAPGDKLFVIQLGDAAINFYLNDTDIAKKKDLQKYADTLLNTHGIEVRYLFIRGNHDCPPSKVYTYRVVDFMGGKAFMEDDFPNLFFLMDGEFYQIEGQVFLCIGGGNSSDFFYRLLNNLPWFADECIDTEEQLEIIKCIEERKQLNEITVLSHMLPQRIAPTNRDSISGPSVEKFLDQVFDILSKRNSIKQWYVGHYHRDCKMMYDNIPINILYKKAILIEMDK